MKNIETKIYGELNQFWETGTEGVLWSLRCPYLPGYDSVFILENKDYLVVIEDSNVLWQDYIKLEFKRNFVLYPNQKDYPGSGQQAVGNYWVHGLQENMDPNLWCDMFSSRKQAILVTNKKINHPFLSNPDDIEDMLSKMPFKEAIELYRSALYSWLVFDSHGSFYSHAQEWNFELEDIIKLLGNINASDIEKWKTYPKYSHDTLINANIDTFTRIALLYGVYGDLHFAFKTKEERSNWLNERTLINNVCAKELLCSNYLKDVITVRKLTSSLVSHSGIEELTNSSILSKLQR